MIPSMPYYERLFPIAVLACLLAGAIAFALADAVAASRDFLAVALGIRLDDGLRRHWTGEAGRRERWQRLRTPI